MADANDHTPAAAAERFAAGGPVQMTVLYENTPGATFSVDHYFNVHMPLMRDKWTAHGLIGYTVSQNIPDVASQTPPKYSMYAILTWKSEAHLKEALASPDAPGVFADIPNFSSVMPVLVTGKVMDSWGRMS